MRMRGLFATIVMSIFMTSCQNGSDSENLSNSQGGLPGLLRPPTSSTESPSSNNSLAPEVHDSAVVKSLLQHKWCRKIEAQDVAYIERWELKSSRQVSWTAFRVNPSGERSSVAGEAVGTWTLLGPEIHFDFGGPIQKFEIKREPNGITGEPRLQMNNQVYDPCN